MGLFKNSKGTLLCTMNVLLIKLVVWLGWLSSVAVGQLELSEAVAGFVNFPEVGISCVGNLAVLITSISKGRLDLELGVRDVLASIRGPKLHAINKEEKEVGWTTFNESKDYKKASVVMLSSSKPNLSMKQFMRYIHNAQGVHSIFIKYSEAPDCRCNTKCKCIVFETVEGVTVLLKDWMPAGALKRLRPDSDQLLLLPSQECIRKGCHGLMSEETRQSGEKRLTEADSEHTGEGKAEVEFSSVLKIPVGFLQKTHTCICIPVTPGADDKWTKLLITSFRSKDNAERGVSVRAADAMANYTLQGTKDSYIAKRDKDQLKKGLIVKFHTTSLILPRLTEILINLLLVGWFRVDGLSTAMVARKAVRSYVMGSEESGFSANAFLSTALVKSLVKSEDHKSNDNDKDKEITLVYQVLTFRSWLLGLGTLSFIAGAFNLICAIFWTVCMALEGSAGKWYAADSVALSIPRVAVIIVGIGMALGMDCLHLYLIWGSPTPPNVPKQPRLTEQVAVLVVILLELACVVSGGVVLGVRGKRVFGKWIYSAVHGLVWVKWGIGSYLLGESYSETNSEYNWKSGVLVYSSAFFLNSMLAGVRCVWIYSP